MRNLIDRSADEDQRCAAVESVLRASARWEPALPIADGVLEQAVARAAHSRRRPSRTWAVAVWGPAAVGLLAWAITDRETPAPPQPPRVVPVSPRAAAAQVAAGLSRAGQPPIGASVAGLRRTARLDARPAAGRKVSERAVAAAGKPEIGDGNDGPARRVVWSNYRVPRYVAGVSTGAWIRTDDVGGDAALVPAVLDVPLAEVYGDPSDDHAVELDVIPVRYVTEGYDE